MSLRGPVLIGLLLRNLSMISFDDLAVELQPRADREKRRFCKPS
jgi:hypothetical protein